jgi:Ca2+-binding EF-hand superfamily protein
LELLEKYKRAPLKRFQLEAAFRALDGDGSGAITAPELKHILSVLGEPLNEEEAADFMSHADKDGDGEINYAEFASLMSGPTRRRMSLFGASTDARA